MTVILIQLRQSLFIKHKYAPKRTLVCRILHCIGHKLKRDINDLLAVLKPWTLIYKAGRPGRNEKREWMAQGSGWAWNALSSGSFINHPTRFLRWQAGNQSSRQSTSRCGVSHERRKQGKCSARTLCWGRANIIWSLAGSSKYTDKTRKVSCEYWSHGAWKV